MPPSEKLAAAIRGRQARAAEWMRSNGICTAVLDDFENHRNNSVRWLSGHPMDALLFLFSSGKTVLVPWDVNIAGERSVVDRIIPYTEFKRSFKEAVTGVLKESGVEEAAGGPGARRKVEFPSRTSHLRYLELKEELPGVEILVRTEGFESFVTRARAVKDDLEIAAMQKAADITNALIDVISERMATTAGRKDLREIDLAHLIAREALERGAEGIAFETLAAGPGRSWAIHPFPSYSAAPFGGNGLSLLDFGVKVDGYASDVTITFAAGRPSPEQDRMIGLVEEAYHAALEAARGGISPLEPARRAEQIFSAAGWSMPHALGHGIGLDAHEAPLLRSQGENPDPALLPGMVITIEPGLYDPKHGGVRWENDVLITETSPQTLTRSRILRIA